MSRPHPLSADRASAIIAAFADQRVVVVGDMVADEYIFGTPGRVSREAPVVVLEYTGRRLVPGGATNVAVNLRALGAAVSVVGVIGDDQMGRELRQALINLSVDTSGLVIDPDRPTSTKTRIVGGGPQVVRQQMVRIDRADSSPLRGAARSSLFDAARGLLAGASGLILSDYEHGVIDPELIALCLQSERAGSMVTTVDAHGDLARFQGVSLATPNQPEAEAALGRVLPDLDSLREGGRQLLSRMDAEGLLITRGGLGMVVMDRHGLFIDLPAHLVEVRDATGAGDTVSAVATLALGAGAGLPEAARLGTVAAGLVVRRLGAATVTGAELAAACKDMPARANFPDDGT
ncbi:MAG: bifunctional heptose 7-phosphate kinase/heptose 1-phosphate adenyltransferase [Chloroflexota bacterium]